MSTQVSTTELSTNVLDPLSRFARVFTKSLSALRNYDPTYRDDHIRTWAQQMLSLLNVQVQSKGEFIWNEPVIAVGNHISYLDPLVVSQKKAMSFVVKKQVSYWPIFGKGCKVSEMIFVERKSAKSRAQTLELIEDCLLQDERSVALFPTGTTHIGEPPRWKKGAFELAHRLRIRIQPFRIRYTPLRDAAYIGNDFFPTHLWNIITKPGGLQAEIEIHPPVLVNNPLEDARYWQDWAENWVGTPPTLG